MPRTDPRPYFPANDTHALFRSRVTGVAMWTGIFIIGFAVTNPLLDARGEGLGAFTRLLTKWNPSLVLAAFLVVAGRVTARLPLGPRALEVLDAVFTLLECLGWFLVLAHVTAGDQFELALALVWTPHLLMRAAIVPSTGSRTAMVGTLASLVLVAATYVAVRNGGAGDLAWRETVRTLQWAATAVIGSSLISRRLYAMERRIYAAESFGRYVLEEKIGEGGMGEVFRARHALLRRPTALKLLPRSRAGAQAIARFEREVQMTSRLTHPSTIQIYDYGRSEDGTFYYAMELIDGMTLDDLVSRTGAQPPARVARILADVCGSLAEAHATGLVHRDIKPQNVMLCARGGSYDVVKVLDFGLVKVVGDEPGDGGRGRAVAGTPAYMAPEAFENPERVGPASDLYCVGALGYFLLAGAPVFAGNSPFELLGQHLHSTPVSPSERSGRSIPAALERLVLACLAKSPEERPASANALRALLAQTGLAGAWSEDDAAAWWKAREAPRSPGSATSSEASSDAAPPRSASPRTLRITRA